ncbi:phosphate/phosphite/phosphonate ABC transporter substrate-binding protein [Marinobacterium rhizophilum]|uniref:Phosphate/phosphite/phosphonate ABC transporter substrate-binding protein n=1 Tax=Marinobacterium rhizophilum TaxID=420402 RepID=A0ABY5HIC1_9GAMM|nr:phosphate/phosphite/phosphonate ABC transporter substrate-binding protein [Marinobacterium rhizophilum]UTW12040.1 phosphate/phosphite/phosphonate ABC transporter substrate-binding protein [Marinobacterium rhizophilum]
MKAEKQGVHWGLALVLSVLCALPVSADEQSTAAVTPLTLGVVPQQSSLKLAKAWMPLLQEVSRRSGIPLVFATAPDIPTYEKRLHEGAYDLAYMNPYHYTVFHDTNGYEALAKAKDVQIHGIYVVRRASTITDLAQLAGLELAYPAPAAFAASVVTQANLAKVATPGKQAYVLSHDAVYRAVASGRYEAGGGILRTFSAVEPSVRDQLKILWTSPGYTPHPIATHPNIDGDKRHRLRRALISLAQDPAGQALLEPLKISGFEEANDADWDDVRDLHIHRLDP